MTSIHALTQSKRLEVLTQLGHPEVTERITARWGHLNTDAMAARARALKACGEDEAALRILYRLVCDGDGPVQDRWNLLNEAALALKHPGRFAEAEEILDGLCKHAPDPTHHCRAMTNLAGTLIEASQFPEAEAVLSGLRAAYPHDPLVWAQCGHLHRRQGAFTEAATAARRACEIHPDAADYRAQLAQALLAAGRRREAATAYEEAASRGATGRRFVTQALSCLALVDGVEERRLAEALQPLAGLHDPHEMLAEVSNSSGRSRGRHGLLPCPDRAQRSEPACRPTRPGHTRRREAVVRRPHRAPSPT